MNWQVVVVDKNEQEAYALGGGIIVSSGLLDHHSDVGIAAVLAHEVGHSVARHVTEFLMYACGRPYYYGSKSSVVSMSGLVDMYQRVEERASYIGSQLMAPAGYDPLLYENSEINYSECEVNGPISLEETYTTHVARSVYRQPY